MKLEYVPLLATQEEHSGLPRGDHELRLLDALSALGADEIGARAVAEAGAAVAEEPGEFRVGLVVRDDAGGLSTNRTTAELAHRRGEGGLLERGWIIGILWTSQRYDASAIREEVLTSVFRAAHIEKRGPPRTLREILLQEGNAMRMAGARNPALEPQTLLATRQILLRLLDHEDTPTLVAALFGDPAARELGYQPLGLRPRAGLALALHGRLEARKKRDSRA
jgi:hypothetical protein